MDNVNWQAMAKQGIRKKDIAEKLGISRMTLYRWEKAEKERALIEAKDGEKGPGKQGRVFKEEEILPTGKGRVKEGETEKRKGTNRGREGIKGNLITKPKENPKNSEDLKRESGLKDKGPYKDERPYKGKRPYKEERLPPPEDALVEKALYQRATGYVYEEVTKELIDGELQVKKVVQKQIAPDISAQIYWLKNRLPGKWRDKQEGREEEGGQVIVYYDYGEGE